MKTDLKALRPANTASFSSKDFRAVAASFPSGVTVITRRLPTGTPYGITASSFTTVSLEPPLILVCIDRLSRFTGDVAVGLSFLVNVLREDQAYLARRFADRRLADRFAGVSWTAGWSDLPHLTDTVATFGCILDQIVEAGDHFVLIGAVRDLMRHEGRALVWYESEYHALPRPI
jgi:flavin reductase ActVB